MQVCQDRSKEVYCCDEEIWGYKRGKHIYLASNILKKQIGYIHNKICTCTSSDSQGIWLAKNVAEAHIAGSILAQKVIKTSMAYNIQTQRHS